MKIFVTGADGFIGSHLVERLVKNKYKVTALCLYNTNSSIGSMTNIKKNILKKVKIIFGDIRDMNFVNNIVKKNDLVINLAALISIPYSYVNPNSYVTTNINGTFNILESCRINNKRLIHTSTSEIYGNAKKFPISEEEMPLSQSPYAATKIAGDQLALSYYKSYNLPVTIIRPFNTFGPRQSARAIIPTIISQALKRDTIKLGFLKAKRNFNYVDSTIDGYIAAIKSRKGIGEIINIGSELEISIENLVKIISKNLKKKLVIQIDKKRIRPEKSEIFRLIADGKKAKRLLNWKTKMNKKYFEDSIKKTIDWYITSKNQNQINDKIYNI